MKSKVLLGIALVVILLAMKFMYTEGFANPESGKGTNSFVLYYAEWCPHCQTVKPLFKSWGADKGSVQINGQPVFVSMVEADAQGSKEKMAGKNIRGYPTFMLEKADGQVVEYTGERNASGWEEFLKKNL
jgi:thiol-disulfide isomerase/thioredoxin